MKRGVLLALMGLCVFGPATALADRCEGIDNVVGKLVKATDELCQKHGAKFEGCTSEEVKKGKAIAADAVKIWNDIAGNSWAKIGPREIGIGGKDRGTLQSPGKRIWISSGPAEGDVTVKINHTSGKAGLKMYVCTVDANGKVSVVDWDDAKPGKAPKSIKVPADGKHVVVDMQPTGALKKYGYEIQLAGKPQPISAK